MIFSSNAISGDGRRREEVEPILPALLCHVPSHRAERFVLRICEHGGVGHREQLTTRSHQGHSGRLHSRAETDYVLHAFAFLRFRGDSGVRTGNIQGQTKEQARQGATLHQNGD